MYILTNYNKSIKNGKNKGEIKMEDNKPKIKNLKMYKGCLIIVDMINGFVKEGMLHDEKIDNITPRIVELINEAQEEGKLIVFIKDTHTKDSAEFERFGDLPHCLENTLESQLIDTLKPYEEQKNTISIEKNSTNFMEAPDFRFLMENQTEMNEFDIVGCCSDICVFDGAMGLAGYLDQNNRRHIIRVHEDAIATYAEHDRKKYVEAAKLLGEQHGIQYVKKAA